MIKEDLTGHVFGKLTVLREAETRSNRGYIQWVCQCNCKNGTVLTVPSERLRSGRTKSCGCLKTDIVTLRNISRSTYSIIDRNSRLYRIWKGMRARTTYESQKCYKNYGGRGIGICEEWRENYIPFKNWAISHGYSDELTIDRIDTDGDYTPDNCKWSTRKEQSNNQRSNILLTYDNQTRTVAQWAEMMNVPRDRLYKRIRRGCGTNEILKEYRERVEN